MADKDINIHIRAKQADESKRKLDNVADSTKKVGDAGRQGARGVDAMNTSAAKSESLFSKLTGKLMGMVAGVSAITAVTRAIQAQTRALEENAQAATKQQNALLRVQFLGDYYKENPQLRQQAQSLSELGRRPVEEVAGALYNLRSKNAAMSETQRMGIMTEALEMGRTDPSMPLDTLVDMFSLYAKQSGTQDANQIQNVLQKTIEEAGGSGADVARYMPQFLPVGTSGGLSASQAAGLWSYVTTQFSDASIATTGLRSTFMGLQGRGNPEAQKLLAQFGVTSDMNFMQKIGTLSGAYHRGGLDLAAAEQISGREGSAVFLSMLKDPAAMMRTIGSVTAADRGDIDLTRDKIEGLFGSDPVAKTEEDLRMMEVAIMNLRAQDTPAAERKLRRMEQEYINRKLGGAEIMTGFVDKVSQGLDAIGIDTYGDLRDPGVRQSLIGKGLLPPNSPVVIHNQNVIYNTPDRTPAPRSDPNDVN